jgi:hypothetical protein
MCGMTTPRRTGKRSSAAKNEPFAHLMQIISRTARSAGAASAGKIVLELTAYRVRVVGRDGTAKPTSGFYEQAIGRDARATSVPGRACSATPVDSGGSSRRL